MDARQGKAGYLLLLALLCPAAFAADKPAGGKPPPDPTQDELMMSAGFLSSHPDLRYDNLDGVQDGGAAQQAYLEAIAPATSAARRAELERQLLAYCHLDTWAMVRLWGAFTNTPLKA